MTERIVVAICGASGSIYAVRLLKALLEEPREVHLIISERGKEVMAYEMGSKDAHAREFLAAQGVRIAEGAQLIQHDNDNLFAGPACGTFKHNGMAIVPCSMKTLAAVASGLATNLIERAADVCLKERTPLVIVPRETPYSTIHLKNMLAVTESGAIVLPPSPAFYFHPSTIQDLADFIAARILDQLGIEHKLLDEWDEK